MINFILITIFSVFVSVIANGATYSKVLGTVTQVKVATVTATFGTLGLGNNPTVTMYTIPAGCVLEAYALVGVMSGGHAVNQGPSIFHDNSMLGFANASGSGDQILVIVGDYQAAAVTGFGGGLSNTIAFEGVITNGTTPVTGEKAPSIRLGPGVLKIATGNTAIATNEYYQYTVKGNLICE